MRTPFFVHYSILAGVFLLLSFFSAGQEITETDTIRSDTLQTGIPPTGMDTVTTAGETPPPKSDIQTTIEYSARDSINFSIDGKIVKLYGDAKIDYGQIKLEAAEIEINWLTNTLTANGIPDSTGKMTGQPLFKEGAEEYYTQGITYNFVTRKAYIRGVVTKQGEGIMHGDKVNKNTENELFIRDAKYTTCNLGHPHYYIRSRKIKVIPEDKVMSGPFNLEINDIPTPLGFAFGMFPANQERSSGIIFPTYGEERNRGFFLRDGGYFFAISDYMNLEVTGDIYSKGSYGYRVTSAYRKRYRYNGNFTFNQTVSKIGDVGEDETVNRDFRVSWSHSPQTRGTSRFSASVNAATSTFNQNNALDVQSNIRTTLNSSVSYSKTFRGTPLSLGLNGRFTQNVRTKEVTLLLPELSVNVQNIYPFQKRGVSGDSWYEKIVFKYTLNGTNQINNRLENDSIAPFSFETLPELLKESRKGFRHSIPLSTSLRVFKHFTLTPSINYTERWYFERLNNTWDDNLQQVVTDTIPGFNRVYDYSANMNLITRLYGTLNLNGKRIQAIRHVMNPTIGFSYRPDFGDPKFDYYQEVQSNTSGDTRLISRYTGFVYGAPGFGESGQINFNLNNTLEMKVKGKRDTTDTFRKVPLLNNFGIGGSYNLVADSFKLSLLSIRANTSLFRNKVSISFNGTIDPYVYRLDSVEFTADGERIVYQDQIDRFAWQEGQGLGQLSRATIGINMNLNPRSGGSGGGARDRIRGSNIPDAEKQFLLDNPEAYVDFSIPWDLRIGYNLSYNRVGFRDPEVIQTVRFNGNVSITPKTKIGFNSGYDFKNKKFTQTQIRINRDLHCWQMNFNWTPFGRFTSYSFEIAVKSSLLQDLKINRNRGFFDQF